jgi:thiosulfate dehydrogenase
LNRATWIIGGLTAALYLGTLMYGLHLKNRRLFEVSEVSADSGSRTAWQPPSTDSIPEGPLGQSIRDGMQIFYDTALYAPRYTSAKLSCASCHAEGGMQPYASPLVGVPALFPMYSKRAGHKISLNDRIEECFVRSENGSPIPYDSPEMKAITDYIEWLSTPEPENQPFSGRGLALLSGLQPDAKHGAIVYAEQCAGCHGQNGEGDPPRFPPLWGPDSFNDGAGMNNVRKMASFVQHNMPQNRMGILSPQEAYDVAAYVHQQKRPHFNQAFSKY